MITRTAVAVEDALSGEWFPADWIIQQNVHTGMYLGSDYTVQNLMLPLSSFLGSVIETLWLRGDDWRSKLFSEYGYPVKVTMSMSGEEAGVWICLLKRPTIQESHGLFDQFIKCQLSMDETTPLKFSEALEEWREAKEKYNAKNK